MTPKTTGLSTTQAGLGELMILGSNTRLVTAEDKEAVSLHPYACPMSITVKVPFEVYKCWITPGIVLKE